MVGYEANRLQSPVSSGPTTLSTVHISSSVLQQLLGIERSHHIHVVAGIISILYRYLSLTQGIILITPQLQHIEE